MPTSNNRSTLNVMHKSLLLGSVEREVTSAAASQVTNRLRSLEPGYETRIGQLESSWGFGDGFQDGALH